MIKIQNYRPVQAAQGCKKAVFDTIVESPNFNGILRDVALLQKNEREWCNLHTICREESGQKKFYPSFELPDPKMQKALLDAITNEVKKMNLNNASTHAQPQPQQPQPQQPQPQPQQTQSESFFDQVPF